MYIREASDSDLNDVLYVERLAFGHDEEAELVRYLLDDPSAKPILSLLAFKEDRAITRNVWLAGGGCFYDWFQLVCKLVCVSLNNVVAEDKKEFAARFLGRYINLGNQPIFS